MGIRAETVRLSVFDDGIDEGIVRDQRIAIDLDRTSPFDQICKQRGFFLTAGYSSACAMTGISSFCSNPSSLSKSRGSHSFSKDSSVRI